MGGAGGQGLAQDLSLPQRKAGVSQGWQSQRAAKWLVVPVLPRCTSFACCNAFMLASLQGVHLTGTTQHAAPPPFMPCSCAVSFHQAQLMVQGLSLAKASVKSTVLRLAREGQGPRPFWTQPHMPRDTSGLISQSRKPAPRLSCCFAVAEIRSTPCRGFGACSMIAETNF